jgi:pimeloyl-ACP methyl ester carboxylesterase
MASLPCYVDKQLAPSANAAHSIVMTSTQAYPGAIGQLTPNRAARIELPVPHGTVAALAARPGGADLGATVLLLPGYTGSKEDFAPLVDPLLDAGLGVVAVDLPGQYESGGPDDESAYLPAALGPVVAGLTAGLAAGLAPRRVVLLGHSFGGLVARSAVLSGAAVSGLIMLCSGPGELPPGLRRTMLEIGEPVMRQQGIEAAQRLREQAQVGLAPPPPELAEFHRARFLATSPSSLLGMSRALRSEPDRVDELASTLARARTPGLIACGDADDAWPIAAQSGMADRLGVPFATVPAAGHNPNVENPAGLLELLIPTLHTWLRTQPAPR